MTLALLGIGRRHSFFAVAALLLSCSAAGPDDGMGQADSLSSSAGTEAAPLGNGGYHGCVIARRGVKCWGRSTDGQLTIPTLQNPRQLSSGRIHSCALDDTGVKCWGSNSNGQATVPSLRNPRQVSAGRVHTCAVDDTGVKCWGDTSDMATTVPALRNPRYVSAG